MDNQIVPPNRQTHIGLYDEMYTIDVVKIWSLLCKLFPNILSEESPKASPESRLERFERHFLPTCSWAFYGRFMDRSQWHHLGLDIVVWHLRKENPQQYTEEWHDLQVLFHAYPKGDYPSLYQIMVHHKMTSFLSDMKRRLPYMYVHPDTGEVLNIRKIKTRRIIELYIQYTERTPVFFPKWNDLRRLCKQQGINCHRKGYTELFDQLCASFDRLPVPEDIQTLPAPSKPKVRPIPFKVLRESCKSFRQRIQEPISLNAKYEELLSYYHRHQTA